MTRDIGGEQNKLASQTTDEMGHVPVRRMQAAHTAKVAPCSLPWEEGVLLVMLFAEVGRAAGIESGVGLRVRRQVPHAPWPVLLLRLSTP